ncbi:MAG: helix-turn-helix domain-containing protein [Oscillospiraceae bacterium]
MENTIGSLIQKLRKDKGFSQLELAEKLNVTDKAVSKWECESSIPNVELIPKIAEILDVTVNDLIDGSIAHRQEKIDKVIEDVYITDIDVFAAGQFKVELSKGKKVSATNRIPVKASVNKETGEVKFYIDKASISCLEG